MPILKHQEGEMDIPYDPELIANLMYQGFQIFPDKDTPQEEIQRHQWEINHHLQKLWGDQTMRGINDSYYSNKQIPRPDRPEYMNSDPAISNREINIGTYKRVIPTPLLQFNTPVIDSLYDPPVIEAKKRGGNVKLLTRATRKPNPKESYGYRKNIS